MSSRPAFRGSLPLTVQDRIDELCLQFEQARQGQTPPRPEDFLAQIEEAYRPFLSRELVTLEITRRRMQGETPTAEEYGHRFPDLSSCLDDLLTPPSPGPAHTSLSGLTRIHGIPGRDLGAFLGSVAGAPGLHLLGPTVGRGRHGGGMACTGRPFAPERGGQGAAVGPCGPAGDGAAV
jgi:hypothetical protein